MNAENPANPGPTEAFQPPPARPVAPAPTQPVAGAPAQFPPSVRPTAQQPSQQQPVASAAGQQGTGGAARPPAQRPAHPGTPQVAPPPPQAAPATGAQPAPAPRTGAIQPSRTQPVPAAQPGKPAQPTPGAQPTTTQTGTGPRRATFKTTGSIRTTQAEVKEEPKKSRFAALANLGRGDKQDVTDTEPKRSPKGGPRKVRVMVRSVDPWSIMKLAFLLAVSAGIMFVVAVSIVWGVLNNMGVFDQIQEQITTLFGGETEVDLLQFFDYNKVMSAAVLLGVFNTVIFTALGTIGALLYNVVGKMIGGIYVTLTDD